MKTTIILILVLMTTSALFGQKFSIGSEFGGISSINTDYKISDFKNRRNTFHSGLNFNYNHNERLSLTIGFHFLRQEYRHETCYIFEEGVKNELVGKIDHLSIPLTSDIHFLKSRKLIATFGLSVAKNIKAVADFPEPKGGCLVLISPDLSPFTEVYSLSGIFGIGYQIFQTGKFDLIPTFKYYQGLSNTFKNPFPDLPIYFERKYSSALLTVVFNYKL